MASKSAIQKLQDVLVGTVKGAIQDPVGTAGKAVRQARGGLAVGRAFVDQVSRTATHRTSGGATEVEVPRPSTATPTPTPPSEPEATPSDVARVVAKKATAKKTTRKTTGKTTAGGTPTKKSTPSAKLPAKKTTAKKTTAAKTAAKKTAAKKTSASKTAATKAAPRKSAAKKAPPRSAAEVLEDTATEVTTPAGTTGADGAANPDTADTSLQQPDTQPLVDPATTKAVASEAETGSRAADPEKG